MTRFATAAALGAFGLAATAGCATFAETPAAFSPAPTLTPKVATVVPPSPAVSPRTTSSPSPTPSNGGASATGTPSPTSRSGAAEPGGATADADPCAPPQPPVIAVCLDEPWGLAPLPDGRSALVGERASGRILRVTAGRDPTVVATIAAVDASHGGGLLGIALSPYYAEDSLIYAYVTTAADARIVRIAPVGGPKVIVSGLPAGETSAGRDNSRGGGAIAFGADGLLYVTTGDGVLRFDTFGKPAGTPSRNGPATAVLATGLTDPTGICPLPDGRVGVLDRRSAGDALIVVAAGADYRMLGDGQTLWTFAAGSDGASDCAISDGALLTTARTAPRLTRIEMRAGGGFTGEPESLLDGDYGLLRTAVTGPGDLVWLTTANGLRGKGSGHDGAGPSDDRVVVLPAGGGGGAGGVD